jgi:Tol biopolymer transport system component
LGEIERVGGSSLMEVDISGSEESPSVHYPNQIVTAAFVLSLLVLAGRAGADTVELVSRGVPVAPSDTATGASRIPDASRSVLSADGRWLVFTSTAPDLVPGQFDREATEDVFLLDRTTGARTLISRRAGSTATGANAPSSDPVLSADGRWIAFVSTATDLVPGQVDIVHNGFNNDGRDVFLYDRDTGVTTLVSHVDGSPLEAANGSYGPAVNADGAVVAFERTSGWLIDVFLYERSSGAVVLLSHEAGSPAEAVSGHSPSVSADGRFVLFVSRSREIVPGQIDSLSEDDVFLHDRDTGVTTLVSHVAGNPLAVGNGQLPSFIRYVVGAAALSADGRWVAFTNLSSNLIAGQVDASEDTQDVFLWDRTTDTTVLVSRSDASPTTTTRGFLIDFSADGGWVAFGRDTFHQADTGEPTVSTGELRLFGRDAGAPLLVNHAAGSTTMPGNGPVSDADLSADGRFVVFRSLATDLVAGATDTNDALDVFLYDRTTETNTLLSHSAGAPTAATGGDAVRISADGAFIAFASAGSDLVASLQDLNEQSDVFLHDRSGGTTSVVSLRDPSVSPETPSGASAARGLSADGRFVVFTSQASDVAPGVSDPNGAGTDVYLWDRETEERILVSRSAAAPAETANGSSDHPVLSADGRWVAFQSDATNLVAGQSDANGAADVFLWDRLTGTVRLVSAAGGSATVTGAGTSERPALSADGRWIAFLSSAGDLITGQATTVAGSDAFLWDRETGSTVLVSRSGSASQGAGASLVAVSADGSSIGFLSAGTNLVSGQSDTAGSADAFHYDRASEQIRMVSHASVSATAAGDGPALDLALSADGSRVAFTSQATNHAPGQVDANDGSYSFSDVFLWERSTGGVMLVSRQAGSQTSTGDLGSQRPALSADGRWVVFDSEAFNLVPGQFDRNTGAFVDRRDVFLFDAATGAMTLVSRSATSPTSTGNEGSFEPVISADGLAVAFSSQSSNLLASPIDGYGFSEVYLFERLTGRLRLASHTPISSESPGDRTAYSPRIGATGSFVAFTSRSSNLVPGDFNQSEDAFLFSDPPVAGDLFLVEPCRLFDTRRPEDGPALISGTPVVLSIDGGCGIPATARSLVLNVTVFEPAGQGNLSLYPGDSAPSGTSTINFLPGVNRANNAIVQLAHDGSGTLAILPFVAGGGTVHVILDVVSYFE